jgi:hemolysin activation/secretion protein
MFLDRALGDTAPEAYVRVAGDATLSRALVGKLAGALTVGAGYSNGAPLQRQFFLGGAQTVRGQLLGTAAGEAYWLGRAELGRNVGPARQVLFGDVGWAGPWANRSTPGRPLSGVGIGTSILDGLFRFDLSRGIHPRKKFRFDAYVEARF